MIYIHKNGPFKECQLNDDTSIILYHHRGIQYCSAAYVDVLKHNEIDISMTQSGSPYENALAERKNGILKNEFYPKRVYQNHKKAVKVLAFNIQIYNSKRPHQS